MTTGMTVIRRPSFSEGCTGAYVYMTKSNARIDTAQLAKLLASEGTTVAESDVYAVLSNLTKVIRSELQKGNLVELGDICNLRAVVRGVADEEGRDVPGKAMTIHVVSSVRKPFALSVAAGTTVHVKDYVQLVPQLTTFIDAESRQRNEIVTPNGIGGIQGANLRFDETMEDEGIYFVDESHQEFKATTILSNLPTRLAFTIPELEAGSYTLEVRMRTKGSQRLRVGKLIGTLTVA